MFGYLKRIKDSIVGAPETLDDISDALPQQFVGEATVVDAFTDPNTLPPEIALDLIDTVVANRPDADALREALIVRFVKQRGMDMYGIAAQDTFHQGTADPDHNPNTVYVAPYARPTAGSSVMPAYYDDMGELHVALVKNWKDRHDHSKGMRDEWQFPGGYMDARFPNDPAGKPHDANLDATARRELMEEINLDLKGKANPEQLFVRSDCGMERNTPTHAIDAFYLADLGRNHEAPPVQAGDDVATVRWVNIRDIARHSSPPFFKGRGADEAARYAVTIDGKEEAFLADHVELLERGIATMRERIFPLHEASNQKIGSQVDSATHAHYDKVAQAHGYAPGIHVHIHTDQPQKSWQTRVTQSNEQAEHGLVH